MYIATFLRTGKETGARAGEIYGLKWTDIEFENRAVRITPEKGSNPRILYLKHTGINAPKTSEKRGKSV